MAKLLFGLAFGSRATSFLDQMPPGKVRGQIAKKAKSLIVNPHPPGCKKLVGVAEGEEDIWRVRSGDYRILYVVRPREVIVIDIGHRKDVYRRVPMRVEQEPADDLHMPADEFDRIMREALGAAPPAETKNSTPSGHRGKKAHQPTKR